MKKIPTFRFYDFNTIHNFIAYWSPLVSPIAYLLGKRRTIALYLKAFYGISWFSYHVSYPIIFMFIFKIFSIMKCQIIAKYFENKVLNSPFIRFIQSLKNNPILTTSLIIKLNQLNSAGVY